MSRETICYDTNSAEETQEIARSIAAGLKPGDAIGLIGELGSGKTCFVQGLARALGIEGYIKSPSFTIINLYEAKTPLCHVDLYRIEGSTDLESVGLEEYLGSDCITVIEWVDRAPEILADLAFVIRLEHAGGDKRRVEVERQD